MSYSKYVKLKNYDNFLVNLLSIKDKIAKKIENNLKPVTNYMEKEFKSKIGIGNIDYDLKKLAELGHPYAKRNPNPPHIEPTIHIQGTINSKHLISNVKKETKFDNNGGYLKIYVNESDVPYIKWLVNGSTRMIPRPIFSRTLDRIKSECNRKLKEVFNGVKIGK